MGNIGNSISNGYPIYGYVNGQMTKLTKKDLTPQFFVDGFHSGKPLFYSNASGTPYSVGTLLGILTPGGTMEVSSDYPGGAAAFNGKT